MFSDKGREYLTNQMNVCLNHLTEKILNDAPNSSMFFKDLIDYILTLKAPLEYGNIGCLNNMKNDEYFNEELINFASINNICEGTQEYLIFDSIRHAFICFNQYGLYDLYKYRQAEEWYPKIIIRRKIEHEKNKIENLSEAIEIYRGTSKDEFDSNKFGQSWTLDKNISDKFAFEHYAHQEGYKNTIRVILKADFKRSDVYFFDENDSEKEVIIDERKLLISQLNIIDEKIL